MAEEIKIDKVKKGFWKNYIVWLKSSWVGDKEEILLSRWVSFGCLSFLVNYNAKSWFGGNSGLMDLIVDFVSISLFSYFIDRLLSKRKKKK